MALLAHKFERIAQLICVLRFFKWNEYGTVNVLNGGNNMELNDKSTHVCVQQRSFHVQNKNQKLKHSNKRRRRYNANSVDRFLSNVEWWNRIWLIANAKYLRSIKMDGSFSFFRSVSIYLSISVAVRLSSNSNHGIVNAPRQLKLARQLVCMRVNSIQFNSKRALAEIPIVVLKHIVCV